MSQPLAASGQLRPQQQANEESQTVKELKTFEGDVSVGLHRIVELFEAQEAEITSLRKQGQERDAILTSLDNDVQLLTKRAEDAEQRSNELEQENEDLAKQQAVLEAKESEQEETAKQLQREVVVLGEKIAEKQRVVDEMEQQVFQLTDRCESAELKEKELRKKAMAVISGVEYDPALMAAGPGAGKKTGVPGSRNLAGGVGSFDMFNFHQGRRSVGLGSGLVEGPEDAIDAVNAPGQNAAPLSPNVFIQGDTPANVFAPGQGLTCTPEYLHQAMLAYQARLAKLKQAVDAANAGEADEESFEKLSRALKAYVDESRRTMLALSCIPPGSDLRQYDELQTKARQLQQETDRLAQSVAMQGSLTGEESIQQGHQTLIALADCQTVTNDAMHLVEQMLPKGRDMNPEDLAALLDEEMKQMHSAVSSAVARLEHLQQKAKALTDKEGWQVEVDQKILLACKQFAQAIMEIAEAAANLQQEVEAAEKGGLSKGEFYKRNVRWAKGLISSAKEITQASFGFVKAADEAVQNYGGLEEVIVWTEEVSAATIRLAVASRVKAPRNSRALGDVMTGTRNVAQTTAAVVLQIRQCLEIIKRQEFQDQEDFAKQVESFDFYKTNKEEMECKIKAKRLEAELEREHFKLRELRKHHAQIVGGEEGRRMVAQDEPKRRQGAGMINSTSTFAKHILTAAPSQIEQYRQQDPADPSLSSKPVGTI